mmetsp:Transcript_60305/g.168466  ORF Transcript_60305/g.168466 Transcript_60305/m.168466 type:complete len:240 (+) Transcript_60305:189-908(+)
MFKFVILRPATPAVPTIAAATCSVGKLCLWDPLPQRVRGACHQAKGAISTRMHRSPGVDGQRMKVSGRRRQARVLGSHPDGRCACRIRRCQQVDQLSAETAPRSDPFGEHADFKCITIQSTVQQLRSRSICRCDPGGRGSERLPRRRAAMKATGSRRRPVAVRILRAVRLVTGLLVNVLVAIRVSGSKKASAAFAKPFTTFPSASSEFGQVVIEVFQLVGPVQHFEVRGGPPFRRVHCE